MTKSNSLNKRLDELASQCVKCGLCLEHCPTYQLTDNENESPRGRIALVQALTKEQLPPSKKVLEHLDNCLTCRHCERVCPAHVEYGELITLGRQWTQEHSKAKHSSKTRMLTWVVNSPKRISFVGKLLRFSQASGLRFLGKITGITFLLGLRPLDTLLPKVPSQSAFKPSYPSKEACQGEVALFLGCLSRWCDRNIVDAAIYTLNACGYKVHVPRSQGCCGAMALHQGNMQDAQKLVDKNVKAFDMPAIEAILTTASGCGSMLLEANQYFPDKAIANLSDRTKDISHFVLAKCPTKKLAPLNYTVALHTPCTLQNCMKASQQPHDLLKNIPDLRVFDITEKNTCCGSAGSYMLENPEWANKLVDNILAELGDTRVDYIATSNIGCALHIRKAVQKRGWKTQVVHPIILTAMSLGWKPHH